MKEYRLFIVFIIVAMTAMNIRFPASFLSNAELQTQTLTLYPTGEPGIYEQHIEFEWFHSTIDVENTPIDISGHFNLESFVWVELNWTTNTGNHTVTINSVPISASYQCNKDNVEFSFRLLPYGITVGVKIRGPTQGLPTLKLAYYSLF